MRVIAAVRFLAVSTSSRGRSRDGARSLSQSPRGSAAAEWPKVRSEATLVPTADR